MGAASRGKWALVAVSLAVGCARETASPPPAPRLTGEPLAFSDPPVLVAPTAAAPLTPVVSARANRLASFSLTLQDSLGTRQLVVDAATEDLELPLVDLPVGDTVAVTVTATAGGESVSAALGDFAVPPLPDMFPVIETLRDDPGAREPGWTLFDIADPPPRTFYLVALDADLQVGWLYEPGLGITDSRQLPNGDFAVLEVGNLCEVTLTGEVARLWSWQPNIAPSALTLVPLAPFTHETWPLADGSWLSLVTRPFEAPAYPLTYDDPATAPTVIADPGVIHFADDGTLLSVWWLAERLDTSRVGFNSLDLVDDTLGFDWAHANAVIPDPSDGGVLVSLRHQDAIVKLDADGDLVWILGEHTGWSSAFAPYLLEPVGEPFAWPYHMHAPELEADGTLLVFDNHDYGYLPGQLPPTDPVTSRVVAYRVDAAAHTVSQLYAFDDSASGKLYSYARGDADLQPTTGNLLAVYGTIDGEGDETWGITSAHLVEYDPAGTPIFELRVHGDAATAPDGWTVFRAERLPSLYPATGPTAAHFLP